MEYELHRVDEHPGGQKMPSNYSHQQTYADYDVDWYAKEQWNHLERLCGLRTHDANDWLPQLWAKWHFNIVEIFKVLGAPKRDFNNLLVCEGVRDLRRVIEIELEP